LQSDDKDVLVFYAQFMLGKTGVIHVRERADAWGQMEPPKSKAGKRHIPLAPLVLNTLRERRIDCPKGA